MQRNRCDEIEAQRYTDSKEMSKRCVAKEGVPLPIALSRRVEHGDNIIEKDHDHIIKRLTDYITESFDDEGGETLTINREVDGPDILRAICCP